MGARAPDRNRHAAADAQNGPQAFPEHQSAHRRQQHDVGQRDHQVELAERAQHGESPNAQRGADRPAS